MKRIAFARVAQETNALSPVATTLDDFRDSHFLEGEALLAAAGGGREVSGLYRRVELAGFLAAARERRSDIEPVAILSAWAPSSGPLTRGCFEALEQRLLDGVRRAHRASPLAGMYLCLHGAMGVEGIRDPESRLMRGVRELLGGAPLVISHDLHGSLTRARVELADAIIAYHTNPHRDHARTGRKAGRIVIGAALGELRPEMAWRTLPLLLGGGSTIDFLAPMRAVYRRIRRAERRSEALAASVLMAHPWNAEPTAGWSTAVVTDGDLAAADRLADELAEACWACRHAQPPAFSSASEAIAAARGARIRRKLGCVTIADASDVVTAGAPGDSTHLLRALLSEATGLLTYAAVRDPVAIAALWPRAPGDAVSLPLGATLDPASSSPLPVSGTILGKHDRPGFGRAVVLAAHHLRIVITAGPAMVMRPSFYTDVGLSIWKADIVVVKNFFPFLIFFLPYNRKTLYAKTRGRSDFDAAFQLAFDGPMHPRDPIDDWRERDRARRGLPPVEQGDAAAAEGLESAPVIAT
ncbi:MAG TPA: M81 family metallopeptidase [Kofleriaceae bacterium]|nr:M81 family metallopeptidase [Kofleriaceae bacterium]